jgi:hypothetical protein
VMELQLNREISGGVASSPRGTEEGDETKRGVR